MATYLHGWRTFFIKRCTRSEGTIVLAGHQGMHVHGVTSMDARCRGKGYGMWKTPEAEEKPDNWKHNDKPAPVWECTCGYYYYRTYEALKADGGEDPRKVVAHITAIGKTELHQEGGRTRRFSIDYFLEPSRASQMLMVSKMAGDDGWDEDDLHVPGDIWSQYLNPAAVKTVKMGEVLQTIATYLNIPILKKNDMAGCPHCLEVNGWRKPEEISDRMVREWWGEDRK